MTVRRALTDDEIDEWKATGLPTRVWHPLRRAGLTVALARTTHNHRLGAAYFGDKSIAALRDVIPYEPARGPREPSAATLAEAAWTVIA